MSSGSPGVVDLHVDLAWQVHNHGRSLALDEGEVSLPTMTAGGYRGIVLPIFLPDRASTLDSADAVLATIDAIVAAHPTRLSFQPQPDHITVFLSIEGAGVFAHDLARLAPFIAHGLGWVTPCHVHNGPLASSATDSDPGHGLTAAGQELCEYLYAHRVLVDVSHVSDHAFDDIAALARGHGAPLVASHSDARALQPHARNVTDDQLRAIAASGGVVGIAFHAPFLTDEFDAKIADVVRHVEHATNVAGIDHVAIGSDFEGAIRPPRDLPDASALPALADALRASGIAPAAIEKVFATNALRVLGWGEPAHTPFGVRQNTALP